MAKLSVDQTLSKANSYAKKGQIEEAQKLYQNVLQAFPKNGRAQKGLNALNKPEQLNSSQSPPQETINQLIDLYNQGQLAAVVEQAQALTKQYPNAPVIWNFLGAAAAQTEQIDLAINAFKRVVAIKPNYAEAHNNMGNVIMFQGKPEEAIEAYKKALSLRPDYAEAYNNMGNVLKDQGNLDEAIEAYNKALSLKPDYAEAHNNMGVVLVGQGKQKEAIEAYNKALLLKSDYADAYYNMGKALKGIAFEQPNAELHKPIGQLLDQKKYVRPREIARAAISLLKVEPQLQKYLTELNIGKSEQSLQQTVSEFCELPLLLKIMSVCPLADLQLETLLKDVRAKILFAMPSLQATPNLLEFQSALALQCFTNEYIYEESEHEKNSFRALEASVEAAIPKGEHPSDHVILCLASYKALHEYKWCDLLPYSQNIQTVIERQINEPSLETHLKSTIPLLQEIADDVSLKVKTQYERNPYPRWINMELALNAEPISKVVSHLNIKLFDTDICKATTPNILIAGCGTGQHSISTAARFKNSRVLAVDLSLSSLAYAKRKTEEFDVTNIEYMQADILKLEKLDRRFDIVESAGVLHHMDQPMKGWKVLVDCLNEGGLMKIGLYSELARQSIAAMQREINEAFISSSDADMKSYRMKVIASDLEQHQQAKLITDFYSLSEFRDLLFHVQEHRFTISQLKKCLAKLGLKFCGFENASAVQNFRQTNTRPEDLYNLDLWKTFEEDNPQTFRGMYQFWCQKLA